MAIIFISPKKSQNMLVWTGFVFLALVLAGIAAVLLLPEIKNQVTIVPAKGSYTAPDISINFALLDSEKVKNLQSFNKQIQQNSSVGRTDPFTSY